MRGWFLRIQAWMYDPLRACQRFYIRGNQKRGSLGMTEQRYTMPLRVQCLGNLGLIFFLILGRIPIVVMVINPAQLLQQSS